MREIAVSLAFGLLVTAAALVYLVIAVWPVVLTVIPGGPQDGATHTASLAEAQRAVSTYLS